MDAYDSTWASLPALPMTLVGWLYSSSPSFAISYIFFARTINLSPLMRSCSSVELTKGFAPFGCPSGAWLLDDRNGIWSAVAPVMAAHSAKPEENTILETMRMGGSWLEMEMEMEMEMGE